MIYSSLPFLHMKMEAKPPSLFQPFLLIISLFINYFYCETVIQMRSTKIVGKSGVFKGFGVNQYLSIPYAKPPVGQLRFQKTVPLRSYPAVLYANRVPPACMQYTEHPFPWYINSTHKSEDCLYLNIWTPADASPGNKKAVMYWIHGGGYRYGSNRDKIYSGVVLAGLGDIVVVTVNFRLGVFGFWMTGTDDAPGNAGLWDVLEGLKWVNRNIAYFGGDPSRITIAGESTGSHMVGLLSVSPLAKGLYKRQIMQSYAPTDISSMNMTINRMFSQQIAEIFGCANDDITIENNPEFIVECLKGVDALDLVKADFTLVFRKSITFTPSYGDDFLPEKPREAIFSGEFRCTELLIGNTRDEGSFQITTFNQELFGFFGEKKAYITKAEARYRIGKIFQNFSDPEAVVNHYLPGDFPEDDLYGIRRQLYTTLGDKVFVCPTVYHAEKCADIGGKVYFYWWNHRSSTSPWAPWMGAAHFTDIAFFFGQPLLNPSDYAPEEIELSEQMVEIWSSFVKDGKPSIDWPLYSRKNHCFKYLGPGAITGKNGKGPHESNCEFFRPYFEP